MPRRKRVWVMSRKKRGRVKKKIQLGVEDASENSGMSVILNHSHTEGKNKLPNNFFKKRRLNKSIDQELTEDHVSSHDLGLEFTRISGSSSEIVPSRIKNEVSSSLEELTTNKLADPEDSLEIKYEPLDESDFVEDCHGIKMEKCEIEVQYHTDNKNYDFKLPGLCGESTSSMNSIHSSTVPLDSKDSLQMDENDRYGKLVALQLRQLTLKNSVEAQGKINELLTAYRLKELENFNRS